MAISFFINHKTLIHLADTIYGLSIDWLVLNLLFVPGDEAEVAPWLCASPPPVSPVYFVGGFPPPTWEIEANNSLG